MGNKEHEPCSPPVEEGWGDNDEEGVDSLKARRPVACHNLTKTDTCNAFWAMERVWAEMQDLEQGFF